MRIVFATCVKINVCGQNQIISNNVFFVIVAIGVLSKIYIDTQMFVNSFFDAFA